MLDDGPISPEWLQRALWAMRETLDVDADLKRQMVDFLLDSGLWSRQKLGGKDAYASALNRFNACLNPNEPEKFGWQEIWALCERFQRTALLQAMADGLGYELRRIPSAERKQAALERLADALERNNVLVAAARTELQAIEMPPRAMRVHPAIQEGRGNFCRPSEDGSSGEGA